MKIQKFRDVSTLSYEKVLTILSRIGLSTTDVNIYIFLTIRGQHNAKTIANGLNLPKSTVYKSLKRLKDKRAVTSVHDNSLLFDACSIEIILQDQVKNSSSKRKYLSNNREKILNLWKNIINDSQ